MNEINDLTVNLGISILFDMAHRPVIDNMKLRPKAINYMNERFGKRAETFSQWIEDDQYAWYCNEKPIKKPRKENRNFETEVMSIMFRTLEDASMFLIMFGQSGTNTEWN